MDTSSLFVEQGAGDPIVFVHGSYATPSTWKKLMERLAPTHHCIAIRLPGHGGLPDPRDFDAPTIETELAVLEAVVRARTDRPIHLVGHSYGGVVALAQALKGNLPLAELTLFEPVATWVLDAVGDAPMQAQVHTFLKRYRHDAAQGVPDACGQVIDFWVAPTTSQPCPRTSSRPWPPWWATTCATGTSAPAPITPKPTCAA